MKLYNFIFNKNKNKIILGNVVVHSNSILIGDPCYLDNWEEGLIEINGIQNGKYPVLATVIDRKGDKRIGLIEVIFADDIISHTSSLGELIVDSATGSVLDKSGLQSVVTVGPERIGEISGRRHQELAEKVKDRFGIDYTIENEYTSVFIGPVDEMMETDINNFIREIDEMYYVFIKTNNTSDGIIRSLEQNYVNTYTYSDFLLPDNRTNVISFSTGDGDGTYEILGHYNKNKLCKISMDFLV
jgi:hypothetical protein